MKTCQNCEKKKKGLKLFMHADGKGMLRRLMCCKECKSRLNMTGSLYKIDKNNSFDIKEFITKAQNDMKNVNENLALAIESKIRSRNP